MTYFGITFIAYRGAQWTGSCTFKLQITRTSLPTKVNKYTEKYKHYSFMTHLIRPDYLDKMQIFKRYFS